MTTVHLINGPGNYSPRYDWQAIELEYRAGVIPLPGICQRHGVSLSRLTTVAKQNGWEREAPPSAEQLYGMAATGFLTSDPGVSPDEAKRAALLTMLGVIDCHRVDVMRLRKMANQFSEGLERVFRPDGVDTKFAVQGGKESIADVLLKLSRIYTNIVQLERQAYGLDSMNPEELTGKDTERTKTEEDIHGMLKRIEEAAAGKAATAPAKPHLMVVPPANG